MPTFGASSAPSKEMALLDEDPLDAPGSGITVVPVPGLPSAHGFGSRGS